MEVPSPPTREIDPPSSPILESIPNILARVTPIPFCKKISTVDNTSRMTRDQPPLNNSATLDDNPTQVKKTTSNTSLRKRSKLMIDPVTIK